MSLGAAGAVPAQSPIILAEKNMMWPQRLHPIGRTGILLGASVELCQPCGCITTTAPHSQFVNPQQLQFLRMPLLAIHWLTLFN